MSIAVALIGPDGSGKTTIARRLEADLDLRCEYVYMGVNPDASDRRLPTTRAVWALKRRRGARPDTGPPGRPGERPPSNRLRHRVRATARVANLLAEETVHQLHVARLRRQGTIVVLDRDFWADYHAHDVAAGDRPWSRRVHGWFLAHLYRKPDLFVYLDAPAEVLHARKGEGTIESLRARQHDYLALAPLVPRFEVVDADRPLDAVVADVTALVRALAGR